MDHPTISQELQHRTAYFQSKVRQQTMIYSCSFIIGVFLINLRPHYSRTVSDALSSNSVPMDSRANPHPPFLFLNTPVMLPFTYPKAHHPVLSLTANKSNFLSMIILQIVSLPHSYPSHPYTQNSDIQYFALFVG